MTQKAQTKRITQYKYIIMFTENERCFAKDIHTTRKLYATKID